MWYQFLLCLMYCRLYLLWYIYMFGYVCRIFGALWQIYPENRSKWPKSDSKWHLNSAPQKMLLLVIYIQAKHRLRSKLEATTGTWSQRTYIQTCLVILLELKPIHPNSQTENPSRRQYNSKSLSWNVFA